MGFTGFGIPGTMEAIPKILIQTFTRRNVEGIEL